MNNEMYRLSFQIPSPKLVADYEYRYGKTCWPSVDFDSLAWHTVSKTTDDPWKQYYGLLDWQLSHEQPVRNVVLEKLVSEPEVVQ